MEKTPIAQIIGHYPKTLRQLKSRTYLMTMHEYLFIKFELFGSFKFLLHKVVCNLFLSYLMSLQDLASITHYFETQAS